VGQAGRQVAQSLTGFIDGTEEALLILYYTLIAGVPYLLGIL
jgi:hypothetical protein